MEGNTASKMFLLSLALLGIQLCSSAELYITSVPQNIELASTLSPLNLIDVPHVINFLMGLPTEMNMEWKGVIQADMFNRPKANLFINVYIPNGVSFSLKNYVTAYKVQAMGQTQTPSMEETNAGLSKLFGQQKPMAVDYELDGEIFSTTQHNAAMLQRLPSTLYTMRQRLREQDSIVSNLNPDFCLQISNDVDAYFFGELQTLTDILTKLQNDKSSVIDGIPDSFYFSLSAIDGLMHAYGANSCQARTASQFLENFISTYIDDFNALYAGKLLSEVNVVTSIARSFDIAKIRRTRNVENFATNATNITVIGNLATPLPSDYPVVVNITFWVFVVFSLATLASSYFIWYMDPGRDGIIYRMTAQRMKID